MAAAQTAGAGQKTYLIQQLAVSQQGAVAEAELNLARVEATPAANVHLTPLNPQTTDPSWGSTAGRWALRFLGQFAVAAVTSFAIIGGLIIVTSASPYLATFLAAGFVSVLLLNITASWLDRRAYGQPTLSAGIGSAGDGLGVTGIAEGIFGQDSLTGKDLPWMARGDRLADSLGFLSGAIVGAGAAGAFRNGGAGQTTAPANNGNGGFSGHRGFELRNSPLQPVRNSPTTIGSRQFSGHALDQMQNRGIPPSVVENTLQYGTPYPGNSPGTLGFFDPVNRVRVIINHNNGTVVTVMHGGG